MISWGDVYKVSAALVPLYVPLLLGFCSVRRWKIFTPEQCESVNSLVALFAIPFFTFGFTVHTDPFHANYRAIAADVVSKAVVAAAIAAWWLLFARGRRGGGGGNAAVNWSFTGFSLSTLTSSLVVGVPMARAMYGEWAQQLVVQLSVFQAIVWITLLLFALEVRKAALLGGAEQIDHHQNQIINDIEASTYAGDDDASTTMASSVLSQPPQAIAVQASTEAAIAVVVAEEKVRNDDAIDDGTEIVPADDPDSSRHSTTTARAPGSPRQTISDVEASTDDDDAAYVDASSSTLPQSPLVVNDDVEASNTVAMGVAGPAAGGRPSMWTLVKVVLYKLGRNLPELSHNPNTYASVGGIIWACIANRLQISLPIIIENSIGIMARCGIGLAMFSMGLFMAQQDKLIPCGPSLTFLGLVLKFVLDPIAMTIGSIAVGLRGDVVRVAIIQAAVPQSITSFIFAKEYGLHPDVLSTAVIVGMLVSVPLIVLFYVGLEGL
ncbi:unnamed protein product [Urochloa decumbens]|uniref:Auxin efflux carrier component n=1 Tax=Urochloa decumbens TaxID=240449 RepID=A0ABC9HED7_9POAL